AALANRLVNWSDFRVLRVDDEDAQVIFTARDGLLSDPYPANGHRDLRQRAIAEGALVMGRDNGQRDWDDEEVRSVLVAPLTFGDRTLGLLELEAPGHDAYGPRQLAVINRFASQLATTLQIAEL